MRVEIELTDEEVAWVRGDRRGSTSLDWLIVDRVYAALPRPIQVGDRVATAGTDVGTVVALHDDHAWVYCHKSYITFHVGLLTKVVIG